MVEDAKRRWRDRDVRLLTEFCRVWWSSLFLMRPQPTEADIERVLNYLENEGKIGT